MAEAIESTLFVMAAIAIVVALPLTLLVRLRRARKMEDRRVRMLKYLDFVHRLVRPDYMAFKSHYGCKPPAELCALYESEKLRETHFIVQIPSAKKEWPVARIDPMDDENFLDLDGYFSFANDGCGNLYIVAAKEPDPEVFLLNHETGERERLGARLSEFLAAKWVSK